MVVVVVTQVLPSACFFEQFLEKGINGSSLSSWLLLVKMLSLGLETNAFISHKESYVEGNFEFDNLFVLIVSPS